ncbi:MAG: M28 family peptidase [Bacteroidota bacterium]
MKYLLSFILIVVGLSKTSAQTDEEVIKSIYDEALTNSPSYENLRYLSKNVGHRLAGSVGAAAAVEYTRQLMESYGFDTVFLQPVMVPHWVRGEQEQLRMISDFSGTHDLTVTALGNSIGTGDAGISAEVVEVMNFEELEKLGKKKIEGKIVFFNRHFDNTHINTFRGYGGAVNQRSSGAIEASKYGAIAVVVRSVGSQVDDIPHTGSLHYADDIKPIPGVAVSTQDADLLSQTLKKDPNLKVYVRTTSYMAEMEPSFNVIGQITGSEKPDEYIVVGGHLDSWDLGEGAHDDGAGCIQSIDVLRTLKALGIKPRHSLRAVMFMNEENGLKGGLEYAKVALEKNEKHIIALESDRGGFTPRGFTIQDRGHLELIRSWAPMFAPYGIYEFVPGGGGADIGPMKNQNTKMLGLLVDSQRYFTLHHTAADVFETVDKRELEMGAATMTALIYLLDKYEGETYSSN